MNNSANQLYTDPQFDFNEFFTNMKTKAIRKAYSIVNNHQDAEDAFQNACINFFRFFESQFRRDADPKSWFYRILVNESLMVLRVNKRKNKAREYLAQMKIKPEHYSTNADYMIAKQDFRLVTKYVKQLPKEQRRALSQSLSGELKRSAKNGHRDKSRSYRARMALQKRLGTKSYTC